METKYTDKKYHYETIVCPDCDFVQNAKVEHTLPWPTFIHECKQCEYLIMESEWNRVELPKD